MASDLSARLRDAYVDTKHGPSFRLSLDPIDLLAAADLIDQQAAEIERLRKALSDIKNHAGTHTVSADAPLYYGWPFVWHRAKEALK